MTYLVSSDTQKFKVDKKSNSSAKLHERIDLSFILDKMDSACTIVHHSLQFYLSIIGKLLIFISLYHFLSVTWKQHSLTVNLNLFTGNFKT